MALETGSRVSDLHALYRQSEFLAFGGNDSSVILYSRHLFLAKNEIPVCRRDPIIIQDLLGDDGTPHSLCPVGALRRYLNVTKDFQDGPLFLHPTSCKPLSKPQISVRICSLIKESQPGSFPHAHDVR